MPQREEYGIQEREFRIKKKASPISPPACPRRVMSRTQAKKAAKGRSIVDELKARGIVVKAASNETLVEELPDAYKDVSEVVEVMQGAGLCKKVVKLKPLAVIKG